MLLFWQEEEGRSLIKVVVLASLDFSQGLDAGDLSCAGATPTASIILTHHRNLSLVSMWATAAFAGRMLAVSPFTPPYILLPEPLRGWTRY